tara:strand:- start:479 stop:1015 length:537 start_codon:yes stop_codon:yes gene_type:complete
MGKIKNKKIGLFGGSFDPPHYGHYKISSKAIKNLKLDELYWSVTKKNPFKMKSYFSLKQRIIKSKLITKKNKKIKVVNLDKLTKSSRTISVLKYLVNKNKNSKFFLILGSDNLIKFHKWQKWKEIAKLSTLVVFSRKGFDRKAQKSTVFNDLSEDNIIYIKKFKIDISSSKLRKFYLK